MLKQIYNHLIARRLKLRAAEVAARREGLTSFQVRGANMAPTLEAGDVAWIQRGALESIERREVVAFTHPEFEGSLVPSRVVGLPGEQVQLKGGTLLVNEMPLAEPYIQPERAEQDYSLDVSPVLVPSGHVWLLGDFRDMSKDSRHFGPIPLTYIAGRVLRAHALGRHAYHRAVT